ncbi:MAG: hypothetical protein FWH26_01455 [Oscillospiraceae bacterium]|nr:hypothetical protein [Oscillospiraceae bacterium]
MTNDRSRKPQDIRSLLFCKTTLKQDITKQDSIPQFLKEKKGLEAFISLGTYDTFYLYSLEGDALQQISKENREITLKQNYKKSHFFHPSYIVSDRSEEPEEIRSFWDFSENNPQRCNFFFITSLYLRNSNCSPEEQASALEELRSQLKDAQEVYPFFQAIVYHSLEICDFVILWRSSKMTPVLKALQMFYQSGNGTIGFTETVCGLPVKRFEQLKDVENDTLDDTDRLPVMDIRVTSKSYPHLVRLKNELTNRLKTVIGENWDKDAEFFFVLGTDDLLGIMRKIKPVHIFQFYQQLFQLLQAESMTSIEGIHTQIGIDDDTKLEKVPSYPSSPLAEACQRLADKFKTLLTENKNLIPGKPNWVEQLTGQLNWIVNMSESCVFDNVCYLLLHSLAFFYEWLRFHLDPANMPEDVENIDFSKAYIVRKTHDINVFVENLEHLADHIIRAECSIVQSTDYKFPRYNMSTGVIEFCGAFFRKVSKFLSSMDKDSVPPVVPYVLTPMPCRSVKTIALFKGFYRDTFLHYLEVPIESICEPGFIIASLTHESSHFFGESIRNRDLRFESFVECLGIVLSNWFELPAELDLWLTTRLHNDLALCFNEAFGKLGDGTFFQEDIKVTAKKVLMRFLQDGRIRQETAKALLPYAPGRSLEDAAAYVERKSNTLIAGMYQLKYDTIVEDLAYLFKECYADLMMIFSLRLSFSRYLQVFEKELRKFHILMNSESDESNKKQAPALLQGMLVLQRIVLVYSACNNCADKMKGWDSLDANEEEFADFDEEMKRFLGDVAKLRNEYIEAPAPRRKALHRTCFPIAVLDELKDYLTICLEQSIALLKNKEIKSTREELIRLFNNYKQYDALFTKDFFSLLYEDRKELLEIMNGDSSRYVFKTGREQECGEKK